MGYIKLSGLKRLEGMIKNDALLYVVQDGQSKKMKYADFKAFLGGLDSAGFLGIATPSTEPAQDGFYIAKEVGIYANFGGFEIPAIGNNFAFVYSYGATKGGILIDLSSYDDTDIQNALNDIRDEIDNLKITDLNDVVSGSISQNQFLVGTDNGEAEFRKLHAKDVRIGAGYQSGEYVVTWNYGTNNWGSGTLVTTSSIENSIAKRDARGRLIAEAGTGEKHLVNYGQLPFKLFETENEAQSYLLGGLAKYGQLIFLQSGPQKGRMLQVNETLDGYNTLFDYELNLSSLTDMNDFPNAYTDAAGKVLMVNPTSSGVEFKNIEDIDSIPTYDSNGNLTATEATTNENVPTLGQIIRLLEGITVGAVPEATNENFGIVKYDNTTIKKNANGQLYVSDLNDYAKKSWVENQLDEFDAYDIGTLQDIENGISDAKVWNGFVLKNYITNAGFITSGDLFGYATQSWVNSQGYVTETQLSNKIDKVTPTKLSYALITPTGTIQTTIPSLGVPIKVMAVDATNAPITTETEFYSAVSSEVVEPTILELEAFNVQEVHFPNQDMFCKKIGSRWFKFVGVEIL